MTNGLIKEKKTQQKSKLTNPLQKRGFLLILGIYNRMRELIKKSLSKQLKESRILNEMSKQDWCKSRFNSIYPEYHFCISAENYIKNELEDEKPSGRKKKKKKIFKEFENEMIKFYNSNANDDELKKRIIQITEDSDIFIEGKKEVDDASNKLSGNCPKFKSVVNEHLDEFKNNVKLYYMDNDEYSIENRLSTNYSALAVLFTKFFENKGAFDDVQLKNTDWDHIAKNWITHLFNPSSKFEDIRPDEIKNDPNYKLSSLSFQELANIYFKGSIVFNSTDIIKSVFEVLKAVRGIGFESEDLFEKKYLKDKDYIRYAKDYGFVDMFGGVDFIIKLEDTWYPIQVKTTATEPTYRISKLGCEVFYLAEKQGKNDFKLIRHSKSQDKFF